MSSLITLSDGSKKNFGQAVSVLDLAKGISISLGKAAVAVKADGEVKSVNSMLEKGGEMAILTDKDEAGLVVLYDTAAFLLEAAAQAKHPELRLGEHEANEDGFFVNIDKEDQIKIIELSEFEKAAAKLIKNGQATEPAMIKKSELEAESESDPFRMELPKSEGDEAVAFKMGDLVDFGSKTLLPNLGKVKHFKLLSVAGAYWQGKSSNPMPQRLFGTTSFKETDLRTDLKRHVEIKKRDHGTVGRNLDLFSIDPEVDADPPYWMSKGITIHRVIGRYIIDKELADGYRHAYTPVLMNLDAYGTSGRWVHCHEDMFPPMDIDDGEMLELRPMNYLSHIQVYRHHIHSYRELPIRTAELGMMYRYEKSGALSDLQRIRKVTLNDGHAFIALEQVQEGFTRILELIMDIYKDFDIIGYYFRLSYHDLKNTDKYFANDEMWERNQKMLRGTMDDLGLGYVEARDEAAFYGPRLDVQIKTVLGNDETMSTIQLDFMFPGRFGLSYVSQDSEECRPVMTHRGIVGTTEGFIAYLTEIYKGAFPTWLVPEQVEVIPVNLDARGEYAKKVRDELLEHGSRAEVDFRNEGIGYKARESQTQKVPYTLVLDDDETDSNVVDVRPYGTERQESISLDKSIDELQADVDSYSREK